MMYGISMKLLRAGIRICLPGIILLGACSGEAPPAQPVEPVASTVCTLDGMSLADYPGPKAQIFYDSDDPEFFCDTVEMFALILGPEGRRSIRAVFTQDMARADWDHPHDHWIDAYSAFYVAGSRRKGSMGPTFAAFARRADAEAFAGKYGGKVLAFDEVTPDMADLRGGAARDMGM
jgi:copper chaperone NosL